MASSDWSSQIELWADPTKTNKYQKNLTRNKFLKKTEVAYSFEVSLQVFHYNDQ